MSVRRTIEHLRLRRHLDAYVDGEIVDRELAEEVRQHIASCLVCDAAAQMTIVIKHRLSVSSTIRSCRIRRRRW